MTKQVEIYQDYWETYCTVCGTECGPVACLDGVHVCEDCIAHPETVDAKLQERAAEIEAQAAERHMLAAKYRALIGKLELPSLADFRAAVDAVYAAEAAEEAWLDAHADAQLEEAEQAFPARAA